MANATTKAKRTITPGVIRPDELYTIDELGRRMGFGSWGLRKRREAGLIVYRVGGRGFVLGRDVIAFIQEHGRDDATDSASNGLGKG